MAFLFRLVYLVFHIFPIRFLGLHISVQNLTGAFWLCFLAIRGYIIISAKKPRGMDDGFISLNFHRDVL